MGILNTLSKNPTLIGLGALAVGLFIFRDRISDFFSNISGGAEGAAAIGETVGILNENFQGFLTGIQDLASGKTFEDFEFPTLENPFKDFEFPKFEFPEFKFEFPKFELPDIFGTLPEADPTQPDLSIGLAGGIQERRRAQEEAAALAAIPDRDIQDDIEGLTPAQSFAFIERGVIPTGFQVVNGVLVMESISPAIQPTFAPSPVKSFLIDEPIQQFQGGGISFQGGSIFETPIENLSLSQIIDKFMVTASQAANIKAIAADDFGDFDFGTNTGQGIGSVTPFIPDIQQTNVSDPQFEGLTAEQIVLRLTGGNIQNF